MKKIASTIILALAFAFMASSLLYGQGLEQRFILVAEWGATTTVNDSTFQADVVFPGDQLGAGYLPTQIQVGWECLDGTGRRYRVSAINDAGFTDADLNVVEMVDNNIAPVGVGIIYNPNVRDLIHTVVNSNTTISPTLMSRIFIHNMLMLDSLLAGAGGSGVDTFYLDGDTLRLETTTENFAVFIGSGGGGSGVDDFYLDNDTLRLETSGTDFAVEVPNIYTKSDTLTGDRTVYTEAHTLRMQSSAESTVEVADNTVSLYTDGYDSEVTLVGPADIGGGRIDILSSGAVRTEGTTATMAGSTSTTIRAPYLELTRSSSGVNELRFRESAVNGLNYAGFKAAASLAANTVWTLPTADGAAGTFLQTNGSGVLSFASTGLADSMAIVRDSIDALRADIGTGGGVTGTGTSGQVSFWSGASSQAGSNNLWWDNTNIRLGLRTTAPTHDFTMSSSAFISGTGKGAAFYTTADQTTNFQRLVISGTTANVISYDIQKGGTGLTGWHSFRIAGTAMLEVDAASAYFNGNLFTFTDNVRDIGRQSTVPFRFRDMYLARRFQVGQPANTAIAYTIDMGGTDGIGLSIGTTAQRPTGRAGVLRGNSTTLRPDYHNGTAWRQLLDLPDATPTTNHIPYWTGSAWATSAVTSLFTDTHIGNSDLTTSAALRVLTIATNSSLIIRGQGLNSAIRISDGTAGEQVSLYSSNKVNVQSADTLTVLTDDGEGLVMIPNQRTLLTSDLFDQRGTFSLGKRPSAGLLADGYDLSVRDPRSASTYLLIQSGRDSTVNGEAGIRIAPSGVWGSVIDYGTTLARSMGFNYVSGSTVIRQLQLGTDDLPGNNKVVIIGEDDSAAWGNNGRLVVYDTITTGHAMVSIRKRVSSSVPIVVFGSETNDRFTFHDSGAQRNHVYGAGNMEAADLTKTRSGYTAHFATDGTLIEDTNPRAEISATTIRHYTLTTAATNYTVDTLSSAFLTEFTYSAGVLTYTGAATRRFLISYALSIATDDSVLLSAGIDKNGAGPLTSTRQAASIGTNAGHVATANISGTGIVGLVTNDTLKIVIQSDGAGAPIASVRYASLTITPID